MRRKQKRSFTTNTDENGSNQAILEKWIQMDKFES